MKAEDAAVATFKAFEDWMAGWTLRLMLRSSRLTRGRLTSEKVGSQHHRGRGIKPSRIGSHLSHQLRMVTECVAAYKDGKIAVHRGIFNDSYCSSGSFESRR